MQIGRLPVVLAAAVAAALVFACNGEDPLEPEPPRIPAAIVVVPNEPRIPMGETRQLTASVVDAAGRLIEDVPVTFSSSDPERLSVSETGLLTAVGDTGTVRVTAAVDELTAGIEATVTLARSAVLVTPESLALLRGEFAFLSVVVTDENGEPELNPTLTFSTSNPDIVSVDASGFVTATGLGMATLTISSGTRVGEVVVTVTTTPVSIEVSPTQLVLVPGASHQFQAILRDQTGAVVPGLPVAWQSSDTEVISVTLGGLVQSVGPEGGATVTATHGAFSATAQVFVGEAPPGTVLATVPLPGAWGVTVRPDGSYFVVTLDGKLARGALPEFQLPVTTLVNAQATDVVVNAAGTRAYVAAGSEDGAALGIAVVDLATNQMVDVLPVTQQQPYSLALSSDESRLIVGSAEGYQVVEIASGDIEGGAVVGTINTISRHPTEPLLYATVNGSSVLELDAATGDLVRTFPISGAPQGNVVSPDGSRLYVADEWSGTIHVINLSSGTEETSLTGSGGFGLGLSTDGDFLYVSGGGSVRILDRASGALVRVVTTNGSTRRIAFTSGGIAVVTNESGWVDFIE